MAFVETVKGISKYQKKRQEQSLAFKVNQLVGKVNQLSLLTDYEKSTHLFSSGGTNITNTGTFVCVNQIAQGDDNINRSGCDILARHFSGAYVVKETVDKQHLIKVMLFVDKDNQGVDPAVTDVLQSASPLSFLKPDTSQRYSILYHKIFTMTGGDSLLESHVEKIYRKLNFKIYFDGSASGDYGTNSIYLLFISDQATEYPTIIYDFRLVYTE